ncbi:porin [Luteimonas sp. M1R5S18]|uniref:Porin n=1 Tax=Luteimonas rhizosphaericola TaxID=3042024 RepID=A0ABT6JKZ9_9GAMM|nr:porin [Luteimonas rhizosphaericola]MDH5831349.1 porin [Luteimonas rhizosphaericola]
MRTKILFLATLAAATGASHAADWPDLSVKADAGALGEFSATANWAYDHNGFGHLGQGIDAAAFDDESAWRRREVGVALKRKDVYEFTVQRDLEAETWMDVSVKLLSKGLLGRDLGALRVGQFKTPVGFDGVGASRNTPFLESALPVQATYAGRRVGAEWSLQRPAYLASVAWFDGNDLEGGNAGSTLAGRAAWVPRNAKGDVLHLGLAASRERPDSETLRLRAKPEVGLTGVRLVDTGTLAGVDAVQRTGFEGLWIRGPWSVQGELLQVRADRDGGLGDVSGNGGYVFGSWVVTGESRGYNGYASNVVPSATSALELLVRYSRLDLDDGAVRGGKQSDWTLGVNWYLGRNVKLQANYVFAHARRDGVLRDPEAFGLRAQFQF